MFRHVASPGSRGRSVRGLILIDPVLDNEHAITGAIAATLGLPRALIIPTAWSALHVVNTETLPANPKDAASNLALRCMSSDWQMTTPCPRARAGGMARASQMAAMRSISSRRYGVA
jgi:hypothetical protein